MPGIAYAGVGINVIRNDISDAPHQGIAGTGNDHLIRWNHMYNLVWGSSDAAAFYLFGSLVERGTVVDANLIEDVNLKEPRGVSLTNHAWCAYLDGMQSGIWMTNNVFRNCTGGGLLLNGGRDNQIIGNRCEQYNGAPQGDCIWYTDLGVNDPGSIPWTIWNGSTVGRFPQQLLTVRWNQTPYSTRYPELLNWPIPSFSMPPSNDSISNNTYCNVKTFLNAVKNLTLIAKYQSTVFNNTKIPATGCTLMNPIPAAATSPSLLEAKIHGFHTAAEASRRRRRSQFERVGKQYG